ncbi:hypothetical protein JXM67_14740 [candidate division WOR-3 bacterium]|nr:hypothetical protein [candidate division WOR-3 bacterium]
MKIPNFLWKVNKGLFTALSFFCTSVTTQPPSATFRSEQDIEEVGRNLATGLFDDFVRQTKKRELDMLARLSLVPQISCSPPPPDLDRVLPYAVGKYYRPKEIYQEYKPIATSGYKFNMGRYDF